ncbi:uroporphyrinogen-III C-methyltransferase [Microbulbifer salipaludis]|uniref:Uroporphyrinogen-III C-methyltransferase n=1 Tax=Microbulbifer salipaludis TaxID=187980 RepID=A0ABS3E258_9GAMM|nr:uroporphyrinogen-III C-methyltransferase [Microbulbifer salipaludis]MBN8429355.1 uroporphyrinogen-III C-methyltransferase [Microbulbifer salipaludis]
MSDKKAPPPATPDNSGDKKASDKDTDKGTAKDVPVVTRKAEPQSNFAKAAQTGGKSGSKPGEKPSPGSAKKPRPSAKKKRGWGWFWLLLIVLIAIAVAAWYLVPGVRQQVGQHLQALPVVGKHFSASASNPTQATRTTPKPDAAPTNLEGSPDTTSVREPQRDTGTADNDTGNTQSAPQPPVPEQPMLQPGEAPPTPPSSTSPVPPQDHSAQLIGELRQQLSQQNQQLSQQSQTIQQLQQQLAGLQRNVTAQGARLSQLGNASREDWKLAEADYLLRLANQRLMLEQDSRAALGLLKEVDTIVRRVDLPDLYGVRQQLARDITALKLVENVDREGLYLRLRALEEQMVKLNIQPQFDLAKRDAAAAQAQADNTDVGEEHFRSSWDNFVNFLKGSVRIRDGAVDPVLLSPQSETRFRQSLRLNMEQAELAVLRADDTVYKDSLNHARQLLLDYGVENPQREVILRELQELSEETIKTELPNLSASQSALRNYIERMHKVSSGQMDDDINGGDSQ